MKKNELNSRIRDWFGAECASLLFMSHQDWARSFLLTPENEEHLIREEKKKRFWGIMNLDL